MRDSAFEVSVQVQKDFSSHPLYPNFIQHLNEVIMGFVIDAVSY